MFPFHLRAEGQSQPRVMPLVQLKSHSQPLFSQRATCFLSSALLFLFKVESNLTIVKKNYNQNNINSAENGKEGVNHARLLRNLLFWSVSSNSRCFLTRRYLWSEAVRDSNKCEATKLCALTLLLHKVKTSTPSG